MVNSEKSGIAFSVHPVTQNRDEMIIEAGLGLGEAIVSGSVTPDSYIVSKEKKEIIKIQVNEQSRALFRKKDGGNK
jgi:pyruvate,water dikinase